MLVRGSVNPIIGRDDDMRLVIGELVDNRLVTLLGPGGVGKTSLALSAADELEPEFSRVVTAGLTHAERRSEVACLVSTAVLGEPMEQLDRTAEVLAASPTLLVLDNCEQALDAIAEVVNEVMAASPDTRILATSRRPLGLAGETTVTVKPLPYPTTATGGAITDFAAVKLFLERVRQADPEFELNDERAGVVASICARADGVPLVIELAAALVRGRSLAAILTAMGEPTSLAGDRRDLHDHQRSVQASLEWSRRFLSEGEAQLLDRLAVFAGSFTAKAAQRVCGVDDPRHLSQLVEHSLVGFDSTAARYRVLEVIRADARARLDAEDWDDLVESHRSWCAGLAVDIGAGLYESDPEGRFPLYELDIADLAIALRRSWQSQNVEDFLAVLAPMASWWVHHAQPEGVDRWPDLVGHEAVTDAQAMNLHLALGYNRSHRGNQSASADHAQQARRLAVKLADPISECAALMIEANAAAARGDTGRGIELHAEALDHAERSSERYMQLWARVNLARLDVANASRYLEGALEMARPGFTALEALVLGHMATTALEEEQLNEAARLADKGIAIMRRLGFGEGLATALSTRAKISAAAGDVAASRAGYDEAFDLGSRIGHEGLVADARAGLAGLPADSARAPRSGGGAATLTDRELAVARLLRGDLTQREIAEELYVAPSTVKTHTKAIYRKLGVSKRSHAITRAAELGLFG